MSVDHNIGVYVGYELGDNKIEFMVKACSNPVKCFDHDIPFDPDNNFDPKTGKALWKLESHWEPIKGYDDNVYPATYMGLKIHMDSYSGDFQYIGEEGNFNYSAKELQEIDWDGLREKVKDALKTLNIEFKEEKFGIHFFEYYT